MSMPPSAPQPQKNIWKTVLIVLLIVVVCSGICCCAGGYFVWHKAKTTAEAAAKGEKVSFLGMELNADLPAGVPAYPGAKEMHSVGMHRGDKAGTTYTFTTSDSAADVQTFYHDKLTANGWTASGTTTLPQGMLAAYRKGDETLTVLASGSGGTTAVSLNYGMGLEPATEPGATEPGATTEETPATP